MRRRGISILAGDALLAGVFPRDLAGDSPRTTSSFKAAKNPCFLSFSIALGAEELALIGTRKDLLASRGGHGECGRPRSGVEGGEWGKDVKRVREVEGDGRGRDETEKEAGKEQKIKGGRDGETV